MSTNVLYLHPRIWNENNFWDLELEILVPGGTTFYITFEIIFSGRNICDLMKFADIRPNGATWIWKRLRGLQFLLNIYLPNVLFEFV